METHEGEVDEEDGWSQENEAESSGKQTPIKVVERLTEDLEIQVRLHVLLCHLPPFPTENKKLHT